MNEKLLTLEEVAEYLDVPAATLYQWRYKGSGPQGMRVGRHVRYRRADVDAWLAGQYDAPRGAGVTRRSPALATPGPDQTATTATDASIVAKRVG